MEPLFTSLMHFSHENLCYLQYLLLFTTLVVWRGSLCRLGAARDVLCSSIILLISYYDPEMCGILLSTSSNYKVCIIITLLKV